MRGLKRPPPLQPLPPLSGASANPMPRDPSRPATHPPLAGAGTLGARALACKRGRRLLFRGLDLQLAPGSITWLRGRNGSGKTSLLRILAGLSAPSEGDITWNGAPIVQADASARQAIVYIGHTNEIGRAHV